MCKLLLLDNDETMRMIYRDELEAWGYSVVDMGMSPNLLETIAHEAPEAIIMEAKLGACDGLDLLQTIRNRHSGLPIILCTAFPHVKHDPRALAADYVVVKGSKLEELMRCTQMALDANQSLQEAALENRDKNDLPGEKRVLGALDSYF